MNAREIVASRGGIWSGRYGVCSCPVCQPESRKDQSALSISDQSGRMLMKCHKSNCDYVSILKSLGVNVNRTDAPTGDYMTAIKDEEARRGMEAIVTSERIMGATEKRSHPYTTRKGFPDKRFSVITVMKLKKIMNIPRPLRGLGSNELLLCVPMKSYEGDLKSIEFISANGLKCFLPGGKLQKTACWIGTEGPIIICEGVATGLSISRCAANLGLPVIVACAGSAANMLGLKTKSFFVMADNDKSGAGESAARKMMKSYVMPPVVGMDFNDYELAQPQEASALLSSLLSGAGLRAGHPTM